MFKQMFTKNTLLKLYLFYCLGNWRYCWFNNKHNHEENVNLNSKNYEQYEICSNNFLDKQFNILYVLQKVWKYGDLTVFKTNIAVKKM